jgi:hypothetical protein
VKFLIVAIVVLGISLAIVGFWGRQKDDSITSGSSIQSSVPLQKSKQLSENEPQIVLKLASEALQSKLSQKDVAPRLQAIKYRGCILDEKGRTVWQVPDGQNVYGMEANPSEDKILIDWGNAQYEVLSFNGTSFFRLLDLPSFLSSSDHIKREKKIAFTWFWLDDHRLLGQTGVWKPISERVVTEATAALAEFDNVKQTLLYLFDTRTKELIKVETINSGLPPVFEIEEVKKTLIKVSYHYSQQEVKTSWTYLMNANE